MREVAEHLINKLQFTNYKQYTNYNDRNSKQKTL
jgi:hypothetical protein